MMSKPLYEQLGSAAQMVQHDVGAGDPSARYGACSGPQFGHNVGWQAPNQDPTSLGTK